MPSNTDQLREAIDELFITTRESYLDDGLPVQGWETLHTPTLRNGLMALITEAIREGKIEEVERWLNTYYMSKLSGDTLQIDNLIISHELRIAELQKEKG